MKPFLVTSVEAARLPRWIPLLLSAVYVVAGLFGRDPWRSDDAAGFGIALTMATGSAIDWLLPNVEGELIPDVGPLPFWLGAIAIRLVAPLNSLLAPLLGPDAIGADTAFRAVAAAGLSAMLALLWYAAYQFGRRPEVQPLDPFGAAASRRDFARAIADTALLAALATFGLLARLHETTADAAGVTWIALYLFGLGHALRQPFAGGLIAGAAIAALVLTTGIAPAGALAVATLVLGFGVRSYRLAAGWFIAGWLPVALVGALAWPLLLGHFSTPAAPLGSLLGSSGPRVVAPEAAARVAEYLHLWLDWNLGQWRGPTLAALAYDLKTAPWFFWPLWPFVIWAIWRWQGSRREAPIAVPVLLLATLGLTALLAREGSESLLLPMVPPMTLLTALALPTIRRSLVSIVDWFAVMTFSVVGLAIWAYWIALMTGFPPRMAEKAQSALPGFVASFSWLTLVLGMIATVGWIALVSWRISRQPRTFWRPMALSSGGMVLTWLLLMTLWLPAGNFRKSYREVVAPAREALAGSTACAEAHGLDAGQRALFAYHAGVRFVRLPPLDGGGAETRPAACRWLIVSDRVSAPHALESFTDKADDWTLIWHGQRRVNRGERLFLYTAEPMNLPR